ncbi:MAG: hypothetical protein U0163_19245 [Gemmatimonadaceae bacterium]
MAKSTRGRSLSELPSAFELFHLPARQLDDAELSRVIESLATQEDMNLLRDVLRGARTVVLEREYIDKDYRNVYSAFYSKKFSQSSSRAARLHLFDVALPERVVFGGDSSQGIASYLEQHPPTGGRPSTPGSTAGYLGNLVLRPTEYSRIGRCLLDPRRVQRLAASSAACMLARYPATLLGERLVVSAFPHQSQDGETHLCAETALWSLLRYLSQRYPRYAEKYPHDVTQLNTDLQYGRSLPSHGLYMSQVTEMIGQYGVGAESYDPDRLEDSYRDVTTGWASIQPPPLSQARTFHAELMHVLATCLESGIPSIVQVPEHAIVAVGAAYDPTAPSVQRPGRMRRSTDFLTHLLVNDDNCAPYQLIGRGRTASGYRFRFADLQSIVVPLPDRILLRPEVAEVMATDILNSLGPPTPDRTFVRRQFCTSSKNFKEHQRAHPDPFSLKLLQLPMPHFLWITEITSSRSSSERPSSRGAGWN